MTQRNDAQGIAVVTGATGGMGAASARALAAAGYAQLPEHALGTAPLPAAPHYDEGWFDPERAAILRPQ